ncbi:GYF domain-containing protein, partial [Euroglyphus maynei]
MLIKWFYCDPQGQTQGPFTSQEMFEWYNGGYFNPDLLVKRATDNKFTKLGELIQALGGRCPFNIIPSTSSSVSVERQQQQQTSTGNNSIQSGRIAMAQQQQPAPPSIQHPNFPLRTNNNEPLFFPESSPSSTTAAAAASQLSTGVGNHHRVIPPILPQQSQPSPP